MSNIRLVYQLFDACLIHMKVHDFCVKIVHNPREQTFILGSPFSLEYFDHEDYTTHDIFRVVNCNYCHRGLFRIKDLIRMYKCSTCVTRLFEVDQDWEPIIM